MPTTCRPGDRVCAARRRTAASSALAVAAALLALAPPAHARAVEDTCSGRHRDPQGVKILATQDGQVLTGTDQSDILDAYGHLGVTIVGNGGSDFICGGPGDDVLNGGAGDDWIQGLGGDDVIHGEGGDDDLEGNAGDDQVFGDAGDDAIDVSNGVFGETDGRSTDTDTADGGDGHDELDISAQLGRTASMTVDARSGTAVVPGGMSIDFTGFEVYAGPGRRATFTGTFGNDTLYGGFSVARLGAGDDYDEIGTDDVVRAGPGDDEIEATDGGKVHGGAGDDRLHLTFQEGSVPVGATRFAGGAGDDTFGIESFYNSGRAWDHDPVDAHFNGGEGTDVIDLERLHWSVRADLGDRAAHWEESRFVWSHVEELDGSARADRIRGSSGDDLIAGDGGRDVIYGLRGDDILMGGSGRDVVWGGPGRDVCTAEVQHLCEGP